MSYFTLRVAHFPVAFRQFAVAFALLRSASAADSKPIKVVETTVRNNLAHVLVYTTEKPRMRILLSCHLDVMSCKVPTAGDTGVYFSALDGAIYEGPNGCIVYDFPGEAVNNTGCYAVQSTSIE